MLSVQAPVQSKSPEVCLKQRCATDLELFYSDAGSPLSWPWEDQNHQTVSAPGTAPCWWLNIVELLLRWALLIHWAPPGTCLRSHSLIWLPSLPSLLNPLLVSPGIYFQINYLQLSPCFTVYFWCKLPLIMTCSYGNSLSEFPPL